MPYNMSFVDDANTTMHVIKGVNELSGGFYAGIILFAVFFVTFIAMANYDKRAVFLVSSFITSITAVGLFAVGMINMVIASIPVILMLIAAFIYIFWR